MPSEVQRLRAQIDQEIISMQLGLVGLAASAEHEFIHTKMNRVGAHIDELAQHVGIERANMVSCEVYLVHYS